MNNKVSNLKPNDVMKQKFKYNINHYISIQPRAITVAKIEDILEKEHGISRSTFQRDRSMALDSEQSIPSDRLDIYAALFSVTVEELKNYTLKRVKPLVERKPSDLMQKVIKRTQLRKKN